MQTLIIEISAHRGLNFSYLVLAGKTWNAARGSCPVIAPSVDTAKRFEHYFHWLPITAALDEVVSAPLAIAKPTGNLRVAVMGMMTAHRARQISARAPNLHNDRRSRRVYSQRLCSPK